MLRGAMQDNADTIADRLPSPLRRSRRLPVVWARRIGLLALPVSILAGSALIAHRSLEAQPVVVLEPRPERPAAPTIGTESADSAPDASLLSRPLRARALALGVRRVVLDAGHGGDHPGASSENGLREKDVTLDLAERAARLLATQHLDAILTRTGDDTLSLKQRSEAANRQRGDVFVSIHLNSFNVAGVRGIETFYLGPGGQPDHEALAAAENQHSGYSLADMRSLLDGIYADARRDESKRLAHSVQSAIVGRLRTIDPSTADRGVKSAPFVVLVATNMPAILAEVSWLSDDEEAKRLETVDHRQTIAEALVTGIQNFIDQTRPTGQKEGQQ